MFLALSGISFFPSEFQLADSLGYMDNRKQTEQKIISEKDILGLYTSILPLISHNPEKQNIQKIVGNALSQFLFYNTYYFAVEDLHQNSEEKWNNRFEMFARKTEKNNLEKFSKITPVYGKDLDAANRFETDVDYCFKISLEGFKNNHGENAQYFHYRMHSEQMPMVAIGFIRKDDPFTDNEIKLLSNLREHICLILRTTTYSLSGSTEFQYFSAYTKLLTFISENYDLSESESKLLPEILYGYTNEEIANRNFISLDTVKSHLKHIFKKTNTKSRVDFISAFFTSPDRVRV